MTQFLCRNMTIQNQTMQLVQKSCGATQNRSHHQAFTHNSELNWERKKYVPFANKRVQRTQPRGQNVPTAWQGGGFCNHRSFLPKTRGPGHRTQLRSFAWSLCCDNFSASNLKIMNYIRSKYCCFLIGGSGTRFVIYEAIENGVITLYKLIRALQTCTVCFPKQIKWCLW